jgi:hypothetical protein
VLRAGTDQPIGQPLQALNGSQQRRTRLFLHVARCFKD